MIDGQDIKNNHNEPKRKRKIEEVMNLKEEMMGQSDCANNWSLEEIKVDTNLHLIEVKEAIEIAKKYAEEMCKELFAKYYGKDCPDCNNEGAYLSQSNSGYEPDYVQCQFCYVESLSKFNIMNAPLATEENDEKA